MTQTANRTARAVAYEFDLPRAPEIEGVTREQFEREILPAQQPVILRGLVAHWPAVRAASASAADASAYLRRYDSLRPTETIIGPPAIGGRFFYSEDLRGMNFQRRPLPVSQALAWLAQAANDPAPPSIYVQAAACADYLPGFEGENAVDLLPPGVGARIWIGNRLTVQTHFDLSQNIAACVAGRRVFTLFPPQATPDLYVGPFENTPGGPPVSMVRLESPEPDRFPRFAEALKTARTAELGPGDAIFIPYFWWHHVQSLEDFNILVNYWWNRAAPELGSPFDAMLHGMLALRDLPGPEREAWRIVFDQYVFRTQGDPVAHLPPEARGTLGDWTPSQRATLWAQLAQGVGRHAAQIMSRYRS